MKPQPLISVIIPAYNEAERIGTTLDSLAKYASAHNFLPEVIVVDDGSVDGTAEVVRRFESDRHLGFIRILPLGANHGKGYATKAGMQVAHGIWRLFMDADNSIDISNLDAFLGYAENGFGMVIGSIEVEGSAANEHNGPYRRILSWLSKMPVRIFISATVRDTQRGFKLFSQAAADMLFGRQTIDRWGFDMELVAIAVSHDIKIKEVPVVWNNPAGSKVTWRSYLATFVELFKIIRNKVRGLYL
jgi:dolichyl-phosphate beta-glucosyltransferase